jgi:hypothetical protein
MGFRARRLMVFLWSFGWCPIACGADTIVLPPEITQTLTREYPGWSYAKSNKDVLNEFQRKPTGHPPYLLAGDFDGDGRTDYAVQIARTTPGDEEQIAIAFLKRDRGYDELILESRGLDSKVYLWSRSAPKSDETQTHDLIVVAGGPTGDTAYLYQGKAFHEMENEPASEPPEGQ